MFVRAAFPDSVDVVIEVISAFIRIDDLRVPEGKDVVVEYALDRGSIMTQLLHREHLALLRPDPKVSNDFAFGLQINRKFQ
jgi:hypothetical protein